MISSDIRVIAETDDMVVVDKPAGILVHPTAKGETETLAQWVVEKYPEIATVGEDPLRPGMMHRLDKDASGVLVIARTQAMFDHLKAQFQGRSIEKDYTVLVHGVVASDAGIIDFPIDRGQEGRMVSRPKTDLLKVKNVPHREEGREAVTEFFVEQRFARFTLLTVRIHTGRTHQIRVHMLAYNHPVVGDTLYVNKKLNLKRDRELGRLFLHARRLCFDTLSGNRVCYEAPLPATLQSFLHALR